MLNEKSLAAVNSSLFTTRFRKPLYSSYCFSKIPATIKGLFQGNLTGALPSDVCNKPLEFESYDQVVLFLIDGFGYRFWEKYHERYPFLTRFLKNGVVSKITSQFPSTTAAHVTTLNTGMEVGQTGVFEWFYYEPSVDEIISPLMFSFAGDKCPNTLAEKGITPDLLFPHTRFYSELSKLGVETHVFQQKGLENSPYSMWMLDGATAHPFESFATGLVHLSQIIRTPSAKKRFFYAYFGDIDGMAHRKGIGSEEFEEAVHYAFESLEEFFISNADEMKRTVCLLTADHGICEVDPKTTYYLNKEYPEITNYLLKNKCDKLMAPAGSSRDFFLYIEPQYLEKVQQELQLRLQGKADIILTSQLIEEGFFGSLPVSQRFQERVGNLVILPYKGETVWWFEKHRFEQHFFGMHGGLIPEEMDSLLLFLEI